MKKYVLIILGASWWASSVIAAEFEFTLEWNERLPELLSSNQEFYHAPAGKFGKVVARNDQLFFENGSIARFWGVGLTFSGKKPWKFPPQKKEAHYLVDKLKSYGFNHVRFVGFDSGAPEPYSKWKKTGSLASETMDRFDYFVSLMRDAGIYYSLSINNSAMLQLKDVKGLKSNTSAPIKLWRYKYVRKFNDAAIDKQMEWYEAFFSHVNPYTGLSYAKDPANVYVAVVNEDSIFETFFRDFKTLDKEYKQELDLMFSKYLAERFDGVEAAVKRWGDKCAKEYRVGERIDVLGAGRLKRTCDARVESTIDFLVYVDSYAAGKIRKLLNGLGYTGLFTGTNNWYGFGALAANAEVGNYIDIHGYFDHPRRKKWPVAAESVKGISYVARKGGSKIIDGEHSYPLSKAFRSALISHPLIFSEWGHAGWSPFSYEGLILISAYAAFQGYPVLDAHTFFSHPDPDPKLAHSIKALAINGNPMFMALSPGLSLAFMRGDIASPLTAKVFTCASERKEFLRKVLEYGKDRTGVKCGFNIEEGYTQKVRTILYGKAKEHDKTEVSKGWGEDELLSETSEIRWKRAGKASDGYFIVDSPNFFAGLVVKSGEVVDGLPFDLMHITPGAITMISLDGAPIKTSKSVLITTVNSFANTGMKVFKNEKEITVVDAGKPPVVLKTAEAKLRIALDDSRVICAIYLDGSYKRLVAGQNGKQYLIGNDDTPWYWLGDDSEKKCGMSLNQ